MKSYPVNGRFGEFGGQFVPETLVLALQELESAYLRWKSDVGFRAELASMLKEYAGRPTPLYFARNLTERAGGAKIFLKREDLLHGGAHKINNTLGQGLLAKRMGKHRVIAETGAGQHGVATTITSAALGLKAEVYMGSVDIERQKLNAYRMELMGAELHSVTAGSRTLKDAINEALRDWATNVSTTYYLIGSVVGPHPYPVIVRDFQSVVGGSNAMGSFHEFVEKRGVKLVGVEAGGAGRGRNAASLAEGRKGVLHGMLTYVLEDEDGQIRETQSVSAGLDYPGVGPEHSYLKESGRATYVSADNASALRGLQALSQSEGIIPALEPSHALGHLLALGEAGKLAPGTLVILNLSGRGDKDMLTVASALHVTL